MKLKIKLKRGTAGKRKEHVEALKSLGLKKIGDEVILEKTPVTLGNLKKVCYLVEVEETE